VPGYSGLQPEATSYSSTALFVPASSSHPEKVMVRPSASSALLGYQRPRAMSCTWMNFSLAGSKIVVVRMPRNPSLYFRVPPVINARPSGRNDMPLQKRSQGIVCTAVVPVCGLNTAAL